eukprot:TRINITY_DN2767_c0_g1_i1.p1 TRINITY_DN2767_c0_g1~~TRINITY_DN2767_c0_g1_i1.p1  ORF type:complete len:347 (+),score=44.81 TRINITY_DN2767_c0_g1_i1:111-1151(+)
MSQRNDPTMQYLSSNFNRDGIDTTLTRMLGKEAVQKVVFCSNCGEQTPVAYYVGFGDATMTICKKCALQKCPACDGCQGPVTDLSSAVKEGEKTWHQQCYTKEYPCKRCHKPIFGEVLRACDACWHPNCFKCQECSKCIANEDFTTKNGVAFCKQCAAGSPSCIITKKVVVGNKEAEALKTEAEKFSKSAGFCCVCGKAIGVGMYVNLDGGLYHEECFLCIECGTPITDKLFESKPDGPVCRTCSSAARAGAETEAACSACNKPLSGKVINAAEGRHYHEVCFVCTTCRKPIAGAFAEVDSKPVCSACAQARSGTMSSSFVTHAVVTGERKPGMRVDPRSGKRTFV